MGGIGQAIGNIVKPVTSFAGGLVGGVLGPLFGSDQGAEAAQGAATAQANAAKDQLQFEKDSQNKAVAMAAPSFQELQAISQQYALQGQFLNSQMANLNQNQQLLNSTDPALQQAGFQAYQLMQGKEAASLAPMKNQITLQRNQLENSLRDKLGSGYATSSAGIEALSRFDAEAAGQLQGAQQNAINSYLNVAASVRPNMVGLANSVYSTAGNIGQQALAGEQNQQALQVGALTNNKPNFQNVINTAGSPYAGQMYGAQSQSNMMGLAAGLVVPHLFGGGGTPSAGGNSAYGAPDLSGSSSLQMGTGGGYNLGAG